MSEAYIYSIGYLQDGDCCDQDIQELSVNFESGGGGHFIILKTERWACSPDELRALIDTWAPYLAFADKQTGEVDEDCLARGKQACKVEYGLVESLEA